MASKRPRSGHQANGQWSQRIAVPSMGVVISDGSGGYFNDMACSWVLTTATPSFTITFLEFATEARYDYLYATAVSEASRPVESWADG